MKEPIQPYAIYTTEEAAKLLNLEVPTIQDYIRRGKLDATKIGGKWYRITGQALVDFMSLGQLDLGLTQFGSLLQKLEALWNYADRTLGSQSFASKNDLRLVILSSVTAAIHRLTKSTMVQLKGGSTAGLDTILRSCGEGLINVKYILEDETQMRARAYIIDDHRDRITSIERLIPFFKEREELSLTTSADSERLKKLQDQLKQELSDFESKYGKDKLVWPRLDQRAQRSKTEGIYTTVIWLLSLDAHLTARGLDRFMKEKADGGLIIDLGQDLSRIDLYLKTAYIIYMALLNECSTYFNLPPRAGLDRFDFIPQ